MKKMNVILVLIGAVVVVGGVSGWLLCGGGWRVIGTKYEDDGASPVAIEEVRVRGGSVAVELRPWSGEGVRIHRTARYLNPMHAKPGETYRVDGTALELRGDDEAGMSVIEYVVQAPAGVRVTADIGMGSLDLAGVSSVEARIGTGSVTVAGATGAVTAKVDTGSISLSALRSPAVVATTGTGAVTVDLETAADVEATTGTGSVDLTVPDAAYRVDAGSGMGEVRIGVANDPSAPHRLTAHTRLGRVTVAAR